MDTELINQELQMFSPVHVIYLPRVGSTNDELRERALLGAAEWTVLVAGEQTAGKGRYTRTWVSSIGKGLPLSVLLRPKIPLRQVNLINLATALSVAEFFEAKIGKGLAAETADVRLKWPNDVWINGRKICGILLQSGLENGMLKFLVIGIGFNVNQLPADFPLELRATATSLRAVTGAEWNLEILLLEFLKHFYFSLTRVLDNGFMGVVHQFEQRMAFRNRNVRIELPGEQVNGQMRGIDQNGYLILDTDTGERKITAGDLWEAEESEV